MTIPAPIARPRFGVVGAGRMAAVMIRVLRSAGVEVRAVASSDEARARRFAAANGVAAAHGDWRELVRRVDVDAVYVANAPADHAAVSIGALAEGKAVLCEKPLACDPVAAAQTANAASLSGRLCMEALWTAFLPSHQSFLAHVNSGGCGDLIHLRADFGYPEPASSRLFRHGAEGVLLDRGVYVVALALRALGPVVEVGAVVARDDDGFDRHAALTLRHAAGGMSQLGASFVALMSNSALLSGSEGSVAIETPLLGAESVVTVRAKTNRVDGPAEEPGGLVSRLKRNEFARRVKAMLPAGNRRRLSYGVDPHRPQVDHFLGLLRAGQTESDVAPLSLSIETLRVLDEARRTSVAAQRVGRLT